MRTIRAATLAVVRFCQKALLSALPVPAVMSWLSDVPNASLAAAFLVPMIAPTPPPNSVAMALAMPPAK